MWMNRNSFTEIIWSCFSRPLKNVFEAADARQKQAKKRSLCMINEHFETVFNTAAAMQIVFQRPVRGKFEAIGESSYRRCFGVLRYRKKGTSKWSNPLFNKMSPNFDMTCVLNIANLEPETLYEYQVGWILIDAELEAFSKIADSQFEWP